MNKDLEKKIKDKIDELNATYTKYHNWEQGTKIMINSFYGGLGNQYMYFFDPRLAECITKQGKNAILYAERHINEYFLNEWHNDVEVHKKLGVTVHCPVKKQVTVYIDTDSVYSQLQEIIATTDWGIGDDNPNWKITIKRKGDKNPMITNFCGKKSREYVEDYFKVRDDDVEYYNLELVRGEAKDFAIRLDDVFLTDYFKKIFDAYAKKLNADNYLNFELETYSDAGIWLSKKKYIQNIRWTDSMPRHDILDNYSKVKSKGVELIQASSPAFAREKLAYLVKWIFKHNGLEGNMGALVDELKVVKQVMKVVDKDTICWNKKATAYGQWVLEDTKTLSMKKGTPATTKGIAFYNYELYHHPQCKSKYGRLTEGSKCKYYYCKSKTCDFFAYEPGNFPDFAPAIDYDVMFEKIILAPLNRIIEALGFKPLYKDLVVLKSSTGLF